MFGVGGDGIFGSLVGSRSSVVDRVFWGNVVRGVIFVDTWGCRRYMLIDNREEKV